MLYVVIWHPKGKRPETYSQWGKEDAQSLIDFYDFAEDDTTVFDANGTEYGALYRICTKYLVGQ